jgi:hypothetical protein
LSGQVILDQAEVRGSEVRPEVVQGFLSVHHGLLEQSNRDLGLNVIWVEDYGEIPAILDSVRVYPR